MTAGLTSPTTPTPPSWTRRPGRGAASSRRSRRRQSRPRGAPRGAEKRCQAVRGRRTRSRGRTGARCISERSTCKAVGRTRAGGRRGRGDQMRSGTAQGVGLGMKTETTKGEEQAAKGEETWRCRTRLRDDEWQGVRSSPRRGSRMNNCCALGHWQHRRLPPPPPPPLSPIGCGPLLLLLLLLLAGLLTTTKKRHRRRRRMWHQDGWSVRCRPAVRRGGATTGHQNEPFFSARSLIAEGKEREQMINHNKYAHALARIGAQKRTCPSRTRRA